MSEEHIDPVLITFERIIFNFDIEVFLDEQILNLLPEVIWGDDD